MIIVRISGGLGNQMFQYALICALKKTYPDVLIKADITDYKKNYSHTGFVLEKYFNIQIPVADKNEIKKVYLAQDAFMRSDLTVGMGRFEKLFRHELDFYKRKKLGPYNITDFAFNVYNPEVFHLDPVINWYLNGYWQNVQYFDGLRQELPLFFSFRRKIPESVASLAVKMQQEESVAVHVRRGDYAKSGFDLCKKDYYMTAKKKIENRIKSPVYYFFSDDPRYVSRNFPEFEAQSVICHGDEECDLDMFLMTNCRHAINANSSFSFWGSALKRNPGLILYPEYSLNRRNIMYTGPAWKEWIRIDNLC